MRTQSLSIFSVIATLLLLLGTNPPTAIAAAENSASPAKTGAATEAANQGSDPLADALAGIEKQRGTIKELEQRATRSTGLAQKAHLQRLDRAWLDLLEQGASFAELVSSQQEAGVDVSTYQPKVIEILNSQTGIARTVAERYRERIEIPDADASAAEKAAAYTRVFRVLESMNRAYAVFARSLDLSKQFGMDTVAQQTQLKENLLDRAANGSVLLEMATIDVEALRASVAALPDDKELKARLTVATDYVRNLAQALGELLEVMDGLGMDTAAYHEQVLGVTGEITTDVFEVGVITNLFLGWGQTLWDVLIQDGPDLIFKILLFLIIVYAFNKLARIVERVVQAALARSHLQFSELLRRMVVSIVRNVIILFGVLIALSQMGISLGPLLAGLGVVGFVVGFALQDLLSNFASGVMILLYRPFDVGDLIEAGGVSGKVSHMSLVNTTVMTLDNQTIVLPNNKIWGDVIRNVTAQTSRRIDLMFGISYSDDIPKTERVLQEILDSHDKVLADPEPIVRLHELGDSSVNFVVRPWVNMDDYWEVYWDVTRAVKMRFDEEGISIPFPQRDVHVSGRAPAGAAIEGQPQ